MKTAMYWADFHTHSRISPDAGTSMADMAEAALRAGMDELCFTDHVDPLVWGGTEVESGHDWSPLAEEFAQAQTAMDDRLTLRLGIELGDAHWNIAHCREMLSAAPPLDFVIGSIHRLSMRFGGTDLYYFAPADEGEALEGIEDYLGQLRKLSAWDGFDVLGHLTLPLRYFNENLGFHLSFAGFEAEVEEILRTLIQGGRGIELNVNRGGMPLPGAEFLRMYRRLGGEIVTLGTDAHSPAYVGVGIREGQRLLRQCGFTRFCTFAQRRPVWHELSN